MKTHLDIEQIQGGMWSAGPRDLGHRPVLGALWDGNTRMTGKIISNANTFIIMRVKENESNPPSAQDGST